MQGREGFRRTIRTLRIEPSLLVRTMGKAMKTAQHFHFSATYLKFDYIADGTLLKKYICEHKHQITP
jgi:hypothetical protein